MENIQPSIKISDRDLRDAIKKEYSNVAKLPNKGYHFHTGFAAADRIGYDPALYTTTLKEISNRLPEQATHSALAPSMKEMLSLM